MNVFVDSIVTKTFHDLLMMQHELTESLVVFSVLTNDESFHLIDVDSHFVRDAVMNQYHSLLLLLLPMLRN